MDNIQEVWEEIQKENLFVHFVHPQLDRYIYGILISHIKQLKRLARGSVEITKLQGIWHIVSLDQPYEAIFIVTMKICGGTPRIEYLPFFGFCSPAAEAEYKNSKSEETNRFSITEKMLPLIQKVQEEQVDKKVKAENTKIPTETPKQQSLETQHNSIQKYKAYVHSLPHP